MPMKASEGQKSSKYQKPIILSIFNAKQSINANALLENVDFYVCKRKISVLYYDYAHFGKKAKTLSLLSMATELLAFLRSLNAT